MKKFLIVGGALVGICVIALVAASFSLGSIVTRGVNAYAPSITKTKVTLSSADISPFSGSGTIRGFVIGNPAGWSDANLASLGKVHLSIVPKSIFGDHIIIDDIDVDKPEFNYETKLVSSNVGSLLSNIESAGDAGGNAPAVAKDGKPIKIEVRHFRVRDGVVRLGAGAAALKLPLPPIDVRNIGTKENGITPDQLATAIMRQVTSDIVHATTQAAGKVGATAGAAAAEGVKSTGKAIKGLFGGKK
jgi:uncharacterized protein involved in outer membrane biogenesis